MVEATAAFLWIVSLLLPLMAMMYIAITVIVRNTMRRYQPQIAEQKQDQPKPSEERLRELRAEVKSTKHLTVEQYREFTELTGSRLVTDWGL